MPRPVAAIHPPPPEVSEETGPILATLSQRYRLSTPAQLLGVQLEKIAVLATLISNEHDLGHAAVLADCILDMLVLANDLQQELEHLEKISGTKGGA
jgi:hypothetical protein